MNTVSLTAGCLPYLVKNFFSSWTLLQCSKGFVEGFFVPAAALSMPCWRDMVGCSKSLLAPQLYDCLSCNAAELSAQNEKQCAAANGVTPARRGKCSSRQPQAYSQSSRLRGSHQKRYCIFHRAAQPDHSLTSNTAAKFGCRRRQKGTFMQRAMLQKEKVKMKALQQR